MRRSTVRNKMWGMRHRSFTQSTSNGLAYKLCSSRCAPAAGSGWYVSNSTVKRSTYADILGKSSIASRTIVTTYVSYPKGEVYCA